MDGRSSDYEYGWCERGKRFEALKSGLSSHFNPLEMITKLPCK